MLGYFKYQLQKIKTYCIRKRAEKESESLCKKVTDMIQNGGSELEVFGKVEIYSGERIIIGERCKLNSQVILNGRSGITIGDDVTISPGAKILSTGYDLKLFFKTGKREHKEDTPVIIGNHCWIGAGAIILPGVQITGEYVVVGAGAVVTKSIIESRVIVAGNPAKIIKRV